ncbi:MAG: dockerin type I repeat-containing protein, partial [Gemmatimonadales bacterium]
SLIYSAARHNLFRVYWVVLNPPIEVEGLERAVHVLEVAAPEPTFGVSGKLNYLDENFEVIASPRIVSYQREEFTEAPETRFRRGDCNADGNVDIADAVCILNWLFAGRATPGCVAATNTNGDDAANITDATYLLNYLFAGGPAPVAPFPECGPGTEADTALGCQTIPQSCQ